jgi:hypothetical protein
MVMHSEGAAAMIGWLQETFADVPVPVAGVNGEIVGAESSHARVEAAHVEPRLPARPPGLDAGVAFQLICGAGGIGKAALIGE